MDSVPKTSGKHSDQSTLLSLLSEYEKAYKIAMQERSPIPALQARITELKNTPRTRTDPSLFVAVIDMTPERIQECEYKSVGHLVYWLRAEKDMANAAIGFIRYAHDGCRWETA